jgi:histone deacetylase 6
LFLVRYSLVRILVVDIDIHHGNGCQQIFYQDPRVLHISIHRQSFVVNGEIVQYSDEATTSKMGSGPGLGYNMNVAIGQVDSDESMPDVDSFEGAVLGDTDYMFIFHEIILPLAREFNPELVLVPAGTKFSL